VGDTQETVKRFLAGHREAELRQRRLLAERGAQPEQAVAECLDALAALERLGVWPGRRDPVNEREAVQVRARWARLKRGYRSAARG
jgi:hypothetical protein